MLFISKTVRSIAILGKFQTHWVLRTTPLRTVKIKNFSNFGCHLEFWGKSKMVFILKTVRDRAILAKFWNPCILRTTPLWPLKIEKFLNLGRHLEIYWKWKMFIWYLDWFFQDKYSVLFF